MHYPRVVCLSVRNLGDWFHLKCTRGGVFHADTPITYRCVHYDKNLLKQP